MSEKKFLDRAYDRLSRRWAYHSLFWLALLSLSIALGYDSRLGFWFTFSNELLNLSFFAVIVYANLFYLIPRFMARKALLYLGLLAALCALVTPFKTLAFYLKFSGMPEYQFALYKKQGLLFLSSFLVGLLSTILRIVMDWWRHQAEKQELTTQSMQSELRFLKNQINPHFLFNTLNSLYALTLKKSDEAPEIVLRLAEIMRYMLYECNERQVYLSREIQYLENYLELEKLRQKPDTEISLRIEGEVSNQMVAPLLFVPFVENSFKHGLNNHLQNSGYVRMVMRVSDDQLEFEVENSKIETAPRISHPRSGGIGLQNVRKRLDLMYPGQYQLDITDEPHRYAVRLHLKLA